MKVLLKIPLSSYSGYGQDGLSMAQALIRAGHDVYLHPSEVQAPLPEDVAQLLTKQLVAPFDVTIVHLDPSRLETDVHERLTTKKLVAWSMWEWESFDNLTGRSKLKKQLKGYDAIIGYDEVTAECFRPYYNGPIHVLQGGYNQNELEYVERDWEGDTFRFCMVGVLSARKNPFAAIRAFTELCGEDDNFDKHARLILKTVTPQGYFPRMEEVYPNLRIVYGTWPRELLLEFYENMHVLLAPSWGEGKNLPALEFLTTGGGVIATNWGGMANWLDEDYAYPVGYELKSMDPYTQKVRAAEVDHDELKEAMRHAFYNRDEVKQKGLLASKVVPEEFSWDRVIEKLTQEVLPEITEREIKHESKGA